MKTSSFVLFLLASLLPGLIHAAPVETVFPGETWTIKAPANAGMDAAKLDAFRDFVGGRGCVVRHGYLVHSWGDVSRRADVASACKPVLAHFLFKAVEEGKLGGVDEELLRFEPRLRELNPNLAFKDRRITWRHVANQISCYGVAETPGTAFDYNDFNFALFFDTLFLKAYRSSWDKLDADILRPKLSGPLQCEDDPTLMAFGTGNRPGRLAISVRDFCRFGLLYLHRGNWNGRQLLRATDAVLAVTTPLPNSIPRTAGKDAAMIPGQRSGGGGKNQCDHLGSYSFMWWLNGLDRKGKRHWPDVPHDAYGAFGHGGPRAMVVIPSLDLVMAWNDANIRSGEAENEALKRLVAACSSSTPRPPAPTLESANNARTDVRDYGSPSAAAKSRALGSFAKWQRIEIALSGPVSKGRAEPNPFSIVVDATFTAPSGRQYTVPGFYEGDGQGGLDGNMWKIRFSADETGAWTFSSTSTNTLLAAHHGTFSVVAPANGAPDFCRWGRLEAVSTAQNGIRYLKFRDGPYWLKAGCDDPENFLGRFRNYATPAQRKASIDYLAARGINSLYIMTHNIDGDHNDVWPWLGRIPEEAKLNGGAIGRFDIAKLEEWRDLFEHMQTKGVVPYLVLEDDSAWKGYDPRRYYREMVARFGYLPALLFNVGEENNENYPLAKGLALAGLLQQLDPFDHPRGIHNVNQSNDAYVDAPQLDFTAIQTGDPAGRTPRELALRHNPMAIEWIRRCESRGRRILMVGFDEGRPELERAAWWNAYLGGAVWEAHVLAPYDRPLSAWEPVWTELGGTRAFMESLPFWEMAPRNDVVKRGTAFCLSKQGEVYAFYLPVGGSITVELPAQRRFTVAWWNPRNGKAGAFEKESHLQGGPQQLTAPGSGDWAVRVQEH